MCQEIGWKRIKGLEVGIGQNKPYKDKITGQWATTKERFTDIIRTTDNLHIEVKYYGAFIDKEISKVNLFLTQIQKDINILGKNNTKFEYWFAATKGIPNEASLHQQIKMILANKKNGYNNAWFNEKDYPNFATPQNIDKFIRSKFKVKTF